MPFVRFHGEPCAAITFTFTVTFLLVVRKQFRFCQHYCRFVAFLLIVNNMMPKTKQNHRQPAVQPSVCTLGGSALQAPEKMQKKCNTRRSKTWNTFRFLLGGRARIREEAWSPLSGCAVLLPCLFFCFCFPFICSGWVFSLPSAMRGLWEFVLWGEQCARFLIRGKVDGQWISRTCNNPAQRQQPSGKTLLDFIRGCLLHKQHRRLGYELIEIRVGKFLQ